MSKLTSPGDKEKKERFENIENSYCPKDFLKQEIRLNIFIHLIKSPKKWTHLLDLGLSLQQLEEHVKEMEKAGLVKRKCDTFHLIASNETIYNTLNQAIKKYEKKISILKDLILKYS